MKSNFVTKSPPYKDKEKLTFGYDKVNKPAIY